MILIYTNITSFRCASSAWKICPIWENTSQRPNYELWTWNPSWMYSSFCQTWKPSFQQGFFRDWIWIILQYWGDNWTYHQIECIYSKIDISYDTYDIHIYHMIGIFVSRDIFMTKTKTKTWSITQIQNPCLAVHLMFTDSVHENM